MIIYRDNLPSWTSLVLFLYTLSVFGLVVWFDDQLPAPLLTESPQNAGQFITGRAKQHLSGLTSMGPRPAGSYENEVLAVDFIRRAIEKIRNGADPVHQFTVDLQTPRGAFNLPFLDGVTHHYRDIQNVIVKLEGDKPDSLLLNCHFDTVPDSPGASDDSELETIE